jgi:hypothetical protein
MASHDERMGFSADSCIRRSLMVALTCGKACDIEKLRTMLRTQYEAMCEEDKCNAIYTLSEQDLPIEY